VGAVVVVVEPFDIEDHVPFGLPLGGINSAVYSLVFQRGE
jgi:hypothetical protein